MLLEESPGGRLKCGLDGTGSKKQHRQKLSTTHWAVQETVREWNLCLKEGADILKEPWNQHFGRESTCLYWRNREATERGGQACVLANFRLLIWKAVVCPYKHAVWVCQWNFHPNDGHMVMELTHIISFVFHRSWACLKWPVTQTSGAAESVLFTEWEQEK